MCVFPLQAPALWNVNQARHAGLCQCAAAKTFIIHSLFIPEIRLDSLYSSLTTAYVTMAAQSGRGTSCVLPMTIRTCQTKSPADAWSIEASEFSKRVHNPIRAIVDNIKKPNDPNKELIPLSLGMCGIWWLALLHPNHLFPNRRPNSLWKLENPRLLC